MREITKAQQKAETAAEEAQGARAKGDAHASMLFRPSDARGTSEG